MSTDTLTKTTTDYKVKDINLADFGQKEILPKQSSERFFSDFLAHFTVFS